MTEIVRDDLHHIDSDGAALAKRGFKRMNDPRCIFTDNDLERLKEIQYDVCRCDEETFYLIKALLSRLEAAEDYCMSQGPSTKRAEELYRVWRKARGE